MKYLILPLALLLAPTGSDAAWQPATASAQTATGQQDPPQDGVSTKEAAKRAKKARRARKEHGPEVYKGVVAKERRVLTDATGAQKELDPADDDAALQKETVAPGKEKIKTKDK